MRIRSKILSVITAVALIIGISGYAVQAQSISSETDAVSVLVGLGLADGGIKEDKQTTRGEFAELIYKLVGQDIKGSGASPFSDVPEGSAYYDAVMYLYSKNIISGRGDGIFDVSSPITINEAVKIASLSVGVGFRSEADGGYTEGYMKAAAENDLLDGVTSDLATGNITYANACRIIYNCFDVNIWEVDWSKGKTQYVKKNNRTILSEYLKIEKIKGIMTDNGITGYGGTGGAGYDNVIIGGILCANTNILYRDYLGYNLEAYIRVDDDGNAELIYAYPVRNKTITLNSYDIDSAELNEVSYLETPESNRVKKLKLSKTVDIIYNNTAAPLRDVSQLMPERGIIEAVDNDSDGTYDVYKIKEYKAYVVGAIDADQEKIYTKYGTGTITLSDYDSYEIIGGESEIAIDALEEFNVISVFINSGRNTAEIYVTDDAVEGIINGISDDYIYVGGEPYRYTEILNKEPKNGMRAKVMTDLMGYITAIDDAFGGGNQYGYLLNAYMEDDGETAGIKLFTTNGFVENLACANKVSLDGEVLRDKEAVVRALSADGKAVKQAVMFEVNSDGELITIDTVYNGSGGDKDSLSCDLTASRQRFKADGIFGGKVSATEKTAILRIPVNVSDTDDFRLCRIGEFEVDKSYNIEAYNCNSVNIPELILWFASNDDSFNNADSTYLVDKVIDSTNENGETITALYAYGRSGEKVIYSDDDWFYGVRAGDVIHCETKTNGYVNRMERLFDYKSKELLSSSTDYFNTFSANYVTVKAADDGRILADIKNTEYVFNLTGSTIYKYDGSNTREKIIKTNYNEINVGDKLFIQTKAGDVRIAVLYN